MRYFFNYNSPKMVHTYTVYPVHYMFNVYLYPHLYRIIYLPLKSENVYVKITTKFLHFNICWITVRSSEIRMKTFRL